MSESNRKDRILELIMRKVFSSLNGEDEKELNVLISHPEEDRQAWQHLYIRDNLINFITSRIKGDQSFDVEAAKKRFFQLLVQQEKKK